MLHVILTGKEESEEAVKKNKGTTSRKLQNTREMKATSTHTHKK